MSVDKQNEKLNFTLTVEEANLVLNALAELPAKVSMNLISKLSAQAQQQIQQPQVEADSNG